MVADLTRSEDKLNLKPRNAAGTAMPVGIPECQHMQPATNSSTCTYMYSHAGNHTHTHTHTYTYTPTPTHDASLC